MSPASQTLVRGLDVLELVASGPIALSTLAGQLGLARSTAHRLASALLERRYLTLVPRQGYGLGPKLMELGSLAQEQTDLARVAHPYLQALAAETSDTVFLAVPEGDFSLILLRVPGRRRLQIRVCVGERREMTRTASGWALLLDSADEAVLALAANGAGSLTPAAFLDRQHDFAARGYAFGTANEAATIASVAAPVRAADGAVVGAIGLTAAAHDLDEARMAALGGRMAALAALIGRELGAPPAPQGAQRQARAPRGTRLA